MLAALRASANSRTLTRVRQSPLLVDNNSYFYIGIFDHS